MSSAPPQLMSKILSGTRSLINEGKYESHGVGSINAAIDAYRNVKATPKRRKPYNRGINILRIWYHVYINFYTEILS
jgi:hypothetical protein